jgi:hypothetical protein
MKGIWEKMEMISFICLAIGLYAIPGPLKRCTGELTLAPVWHLQLAELFSTLLNKTSEKITRHQAQSTMHLLLSYAQNNGTKPLPQVSGLTHFVSGSVPAVRNLTRKNINEITRGWYSTLTAGTVP